MVPSTRCHTPSTPTRYYVGRTIAPCSCSSILPGSATSSSRQVAAGLGSAGRTMLQNSSAFQLIHATIVRCEREERRSFKGSATQTRSSTGSSSSSSGQGPSSGRLSPKDVSLENKGINKVPVSLTMRPELYSYLLEHTREHVALAALRAETAELMGSHMQITPEQGTLLALLAELAGVKRAIEVGVFTGYSALSVALVLPEDGVLMALDKDPRSMAVAMKYFELAGVTHKVNVMMAPAIESLRQLLQQYGPNTFDFAFIDADKRMYDTVRGMPYTITAVDMFRCTSHVYTHLHTCPGATYPVRWLLLCKCLQPNSQYYELILQLIRPGGLIVVDNVLFYGKVADPDVDDKATLALRDFNAKILSDIRISLSIIPVGDGLALCRKRE